MKLPSRRTLLKFGRDAVVAAVVAIAAYVSDNATSLDMSPEITALVVAVALAIYRWGRDDVRTPQ